MARIQVGTTWVSYDPHPFEAVTYDPKANASVEYHKADWCASHGSFDGWCEHDRPYEHKLEAAR